MRFRLPIYKPRQPDPISLGVMAPPPPPRRTTPETPLTWRERRKQRRWMDRHFWGLVHDHDWLQYDPPRED